MFIIFSFAPSDPVVSSDYNALVMLLFHRLDEDDDKHFVVSSIIFLAQFKNIN